MRRITFSGIAAFLFVFSIAALASDGPATKPIVNQAVLEARIAKLEKENAMLREKIAELIRPKPKRDIKTVKQVLEEMPKDQQPEPGGDWSGVGGQLAMAWVQNNIPGRIFNGRLKYTFSQIRQDDKSLPYIEALFLEESMDAQILDGQTSVACKFSKQYMDAFRKMNKGSTISVRGEIKSISFKARGQGDEARFLFSFEIGEPAIVK